MIKAYFQVVLRFENGGAVPTWWWTANVAGWKHPSGKKLMHLAPTATVLSEESLSTNRQIRTALTAYRAHTTI